MRLVGGTDMAKMFFQEEAGMTSRKVLQRSHCGVAQTAIERHRLEIEGVKIAAMTTALQRGALC